MTVVSADKVYCSNRENHKIMSLVWLVLFNGNIPAIVAALICLQTMIFFQRTGFGESKTFFGGPNFTPYMMGLGQGNRAAPPLGIQLSSIMVNVFKRLGKGAFIIDPITSKMIHTMETLFKDDADLYTWREGVTDKIELWHHTQLDLATWSCLLDATSRAKPKKCFWYTLDYVCPNGDRTHADMVPHILVITNPGKKHVCCEK
jgi:hypothetical protein